MSTTLALLTVIPKEVNAVVIAKLIDTVCENLSDKTKARIAYQVVADVIQGKKNKQIVKELQSSQFEWDHPFYDPFHEKLNEHDDFIVHPFDIAEGISQCGRCKSKRTFSSQVQVRSCDEPMTTFSRCADCGNTWSYSG